MRQGSASLHNKMCEKDDMHIIEMQKKKNHPCDSESSPVDSYICTAVRASMLNNLA